MLPGSTWVGRYGTVPPRAKACLLPVRRSLPGAPSKVLLIPVQPSNNVPMSSGMTLLFFSYLCFFFLVS